MDMSGVTDVVCQAHEAMTCPTSDLQHALATGDTERPNTKVTDCVFARISNEIVRAADPIIEASWAVPCRLSFCHDTVLTMQRTRGHRLFEWACATRRWPVPHELHDVRKSHDA